MADIANFTLRDLTETSAALRQLGKDASSMEQVAERIVRLLYEQLLNGPSGQRACALVRCFKTHPWQQLSPTLRRYAQDMLGQPPQPPSMPCLTLLATAGDEPDWNHRTKSRGHQAIPLTSPKAVEAAPMIANLIKQLGVEIATVVQPDPSLLVDLSQRTFNVFYVPHAAGSPFIPAQAEFVIPHKIQSVLGFGGILPSGGLFAVILFAKALISRETSEMFKPLALSAKMAVLPFEEAVFAA